MQILLEFERRLTGIEFRLTGLESRKQPFDWGEFLKGFWGKAILLLVLLAVQVPLKEAVLTVLK